MKRWKAQPLDQRAVTARLGAIDSLKRMNLLSSEESLNYHRSYDPLKRLLGYPISMKDHEFCACMTMQDVETCELLAGPHGYAIYKMLEVRKRRRIIE